MTALDEMIRKLVEDEVAKQLAAKRNVQIPLNVGPVGSSLDPENQPHQCKAEITLQSGHTLNCIERGMHTTHRFAVDL